MQQHSHYCKLLLYSIKDITKIKNRLWKDTAHMKKE